MSKIFQWFLARLSKQNKAHSGVLLSEKFQILLSRECARADRNSHGFSLVIYDVSKSSNSHALINTLKNKIRYFDVMGWIDNEQLAVFLPETLHDGARKFIERTSADVNEWAASMQPVVKIYAGAMAPAFEEQVA